MAVFAIFVAAMGMAFGFSAPVGAADEASGSAYGLFAQGLVDIDPEPEVTFPPGGQDTTIEIDLGALLLACTLNASSQGFDAAGNEVDNVADAESVESSASVESAVLLGNPDADCEGTGGDPGSGGLVDFLDDLVDDILGGTGIAITVIASECTADENGARGSSTLVGLDGGDALIGDLLGEGLDLNELAFDLGLGLDADLGILQLVLDEQIEDPDGNGITVRALRLTLFPGTGGGEPLQEVILAESQCRLVADGGTTTTTRPRRTTTTTPAGPDNDATNDSDISNVSDGTAVIETGDANAVGNISNTEINQTGNATGRRAGVDQDATVVNVGEANANTGGNTAIGNNSLNVARNRQSAFASNFERTTTGTIPGANTASNSSSASNTSDGLAAIRTGEANAVGNVSNTEVNQTGNAAGRRAGVDQDATVVNVGEANANTGDNTAIGNNSANFAGNRQTAVAVGDDGAVNPCCPQPEGANTAGNTSTAANTSDGTAAISTGDATAVGNVSETAIDQNASATGGSGPCGGSCPPPPCGGSCPPPPCGGSCPPPPCDECPQPCPEPECPGQCPDPEPECPGQCPDPEPECPQECPDRNPCEPQPCGGTCGNPWTHGFGWSSVSQSATVANSGSASANTGGNTAVGNNSTNVANNRQTAVAAGD